MAFDEIDPAALREASIEQPSDKGRLAIAALGAYGILKLLGADGSEHIPGSLETIGYVANSAAIYQGIPPAIRAIHRKILKHMNSD